MASSIHTTARQQGPPSFSRTTTSTSMNGLHHSQSQSQFSSFDGMTSIASTPTATPPPRSQSSMYGMSNGRGFGPNGFGSQQNLYQQNVKPQIYTAVYSGVAVYEMMINSIAVMRRRKDSWLNATQILKIAGLDKGKRTKILEKEIVPGEHEKVQGGYGRYQGTWINYNRGVEFCRQYGVLELMQPLLEYDMGQDGTSSAGQGGLETPTKEQAMAAQRKRLYNGPDARQPGQSPSGTFFQNISTTAATAVNAINKTRFESPAVKPPSNLQRSNSFRRPSHPSASQDSQFPMGSQQIFHSAASEVSFSGSSNHLTNGRGHQSKVELDNGDVVEPPRKRMRPSFASSHHESFDGAQRMDVDSIAEETPTEPNESFYQHAGLRGDPRHESDYIIEPLPRPKNALEEEKVTQILDLFSVNDQTNIASHPVFKSLSGEDLEWPLDDTGNSAMHWASTLGRVSLVKALLARGANLYRGNDAGESVLARACTARNNLDYRTFPELLQILGPLIALRDNRGRTILHHIAINSAIEGRDATGKYYLESLLEFVVRQSGTSQTSNDDNKSHGENGVNRGGPKVIGLGKFMSEIVNAQDESGDTALNLAAKGNVTSIIQQLLEVGADPEIPNSTGLRPSDFGVTSKGKQPTPDGQDRHPREAPRSNTRSAETALEEAKQEFLREQAKMFDVAAALRRPAFEETFTEQEKTHAEIRRLTHEITEKRKILQAKREKKQKTDMLKLRMANMRKMEADLRNKLGLEENAEVEKTPFGTFDYRWGGLDSNNPQLKRFLDPKTRPAFSDLTESDKAFLSTLPSLERLKQAKSFFQSWTEELNEETKQLKKKDAALLAKYRRIVSLATGRPEHEVDEQAEKLMQALRSEKGVPADSEKIERFLGHMRSVTERMPEEEGGDI